jgi:hypothetical protein
MPSFNTNTNTFGGTNNNTPTTKTAADEIKRQLGLTARYAFEGPAELLGIVSDPLTETYNFATGSQIPRLGSAVSQLLDRAGLPRPETTLEKIVGVGAKVGTGAGGGGALVKGTQALGRGATRLLSVDDAKQSPNFLNFLSEKPIAQGVGGLGSETAVQGAMGLGIQNPAALLGLGLLGGTVTPPSADTVKRAGGALTETVGQLKNPKISSPINIGSYKPSISLPIPSILRGIGVAPNLRSSAEKAVGDFFVSRSTSPGRTTQTLKDPIETFTMNPDIQPPGKPVPYATQSTGAIAMSQADDLGFAQIDSYIKSMFNDDALNAFERNRIYDQQIQFLLDGWLPKGGKTSGQAQVNRNLMNMFPESAKPFFNELKENKTLLNNNGFNDAGVFLRLKTVIEDAAQKEGNLFDPETQTALNRVKKIIKVGEYEKASNFDSVKGISDPENLYAIRKTIQDMIEGKIKKDDGMSRYKAMQLRPIINEIDDIFMQQESVLTNMGRDRLPAINPKTNKAYETTDPEYNSRWMNYLQEYSKNKTLEAQFDLIESLANKGSSITVGADGSRQIGLPFHRAWEKKVKEHRGILSEGQAQTLQNIADDIEMAKQTELPFIKTGGSDTFKNLSIASVLSRFAGGNMPPEIKRTGSHKLLDALFIDNDEQVKQVLLQAWLDPTFAAKLMQDATDRNIASLGKSLLENAQGGFVGGAKTTSNAPE